MLESGQGMQQSSRAMVAALKALHEQQHRVEDTALPT